MSATMYILREIGPTGFLLKEDSESRNVRVFLGDPHHCSCPTFKKDRSDLCRHICWLLLKKFSVPPHDPGVLLSRINRSLGSVFGSLSFKNIIPWLSDRKSHKLVVNYADTAGFDSLKHYN